MSLNDEYWLWTQDTSSRFNAKTLIYGGFSHQPLLVKSLFLEKSCEVFLGFCLSLDMGRNLRLVFLDFLPLATSSAENHSVFVSLAYALTLSTTFRLTHKSTSCFILVLDEMAGLSVFK
jgi:hypothetical protein